MDEQRFAPPGAVVADVGAVAASVPESTLKKIRQAWIAALISAGITCIFSVLGMVGVGSLGFGAGNLLDVALMLGLAYGIRRNSRVCAVLMLVYFLISKYLMFKASGQFSGGIMAVIFMWFYAQGIVGTFEYHKRLKR